MKYAIAILLLTSSVTYACEFTHEYKQAMYETIKWARYEHEECISSVNQYLYWQRVAKCKKEGRGEKIGGGCQHVESYRNSGELHNTLSRHCELLKVSDEEREEALAKHVKQMKIIKCVPGSSTDGSK